MNNGKFIFLSLNLYIDIEDEVSKLKKTYAEMMQRPISSTV